MHQVELVVPAQVVVLMSGGQGVSCVQDGCLNHHVGTSFVQRHGVGGSQDAEVGDDGGVVMVPAVAFRRHVHDEADVEVRLVLHHCQ